MNAPNTRGWKQRQALAKMRGVKTPERRLIEAQRNALFLGLPIPDALPKSDVTGFEALLEGSSHPAPDAAPAPVAAPVVVASVEPAAPAAPVLPANIDADAATSTEDALAELEPAKAPKGRRKASA